MNIYNLAKRIQLGKKWIFLFLPVLLLIAPLISTEWAGVGIAIGWLWISLPGYLLSLILLDRISMLERIPIAFVLAIGVNTLYTTIAILMHLHLDLLVGLSLLAYVVCFVIFTRVRSRTREISKSGKGNLKQVIPVNLASTNLIFVVIVVVVVGLLTYASTVWPPTGDDISGMAFFEETLRLDRISGTEPFHGSGTPSTPRNELTVWAHQHVLVCKIAGASTEQCFLNSRPVFILLSFFAVFTFMIRFIRREQLAFLIFSGWAVYLLATMDFDGHGSNLVTRILQDKFVGWFIVIPVLLTFIDNYLDGGHRSDLLCFAVGSFGAALIHPITFATLMILAGSFGITYLLLSRSKKTLKLVTGIALVLLICTIIPAIQYLRYVDISPIDELGLRDAVEFGRTNMALLRYRLWLLDGDNFVLHPAILTEPVTLFGLILLLPNLLLNRRKRSAQVTATILLLMISLFYVPPLTALVGKLVTPYLIWRLAWALPLFSIIVIGSALWTASLRLMEFISKRWRRLESIETSSAVLGMALLPIFLAVPAIQSGWLNYFERLSNEPFSSCSLAQEAIEFLDDRAQFEPISVLASRKLNYCIPARAALANVIEYRGFGTINRLPREEIDESFQRIFDVAYFGSTGFVDDELIEVIDRYEVEYILLERERTGIEFQFRLLEDLFTLVYRDPHYAIFELKDPMRVSEFVKGSSWLRVQDWSTAQQTFETLIKDESQIALGLFGQGMAYEGLGDIDSAIDSYLSVLEIVGDEPALLSRLGKLSILERNASEAKSYFQAAIEDDPHRAEYYEYLGYAQILSGDKSSAIESFENSISLNAVHGTASYYTSLGNLLSSAYLHQEAIQAYAEAISIDSTAARYVDLGVEFAGMEEFDLALKALDRASEIDPWLDLPYVQKGLIAQINGDFGDAIEQYERAVNLNPAHSSTYVLLGQSLYEQVGYEAAVSTLKDYQSLSSIIPGPRNGLIPLYVGAGVIDEALSDMSAIETILPLDSSTLAASGFLHLISGDGSQAKDLFERAYIFDPELISVQLGLTNIYAEGLEYKSQIYQLNQLILSEPTAIWPHIQLASVYRNIGDWDASESELLMALDLSPENPQVLISLGDFNQSIMDLESAASAYQHALEQEPSNSYALVQLGRVYMKMGNFDQAEVNFQNALEIDNHDTYASSQLIDLYWSQGRLEEALIPITATVEGMPESSYALLLRANTDRRMGNRESALELYKQASEVEFSQAQEYIVGAYLESTPEIFSRSILNFFGSSLRPSPIAGIVSLTAGNFFVEVGQFDEAEGIFRYGLSLPYPSPDFYQALANLQAIQGEWAEVEKTLSLAVQANPANAEPYYYRGLYLLERGNEVEAVSNLERAITVNPAYVQSYISLSEIAQFNGDFTEGRNYLKQALAIEPTSIDVNQALARLFENQGDLVGAEEILLNLVEVHPFEIQSHFGLSQFYLRQNQVDDALQLLLNIGPWAESNPNLNLLLGEVYLDLNLPAKALEEVGKAIPLDLSNPEPYLALTDLHQTYRNWDNALEELARATEINPFNVDTQLRAGDLLLRLGDQANALEHFESARILDYSRAEALLAIGNYWLSQAEWGKAINAFSQAVEQNPVDAQPYILLSTAYQLSGDVDRALEAINIGAKECLDKQEIYIARAVLHETNANWVKAELDYKRSLAINPGNVRVVILLADFYRNRGRFDEALGVLNNAKDFLGNQPELVSEIGKTHAALGNWSEAKMSFQESIEHGGDEGTAYLNLARILEFEGDVQASLEHYELATKSISQLSAAYAEYGDALFAQQEKASAREAYLRAFNLDQSNLYALISLDRVNNQLGIPSSEIDSVISRELEAPTSNLYNMIAELARIRGDLDGSKTWIDLAIEMEPSYSQAWFTLATHFETIGDYSNAIEAVNKALAFEPNSWSFQVFKGTVLDQLGEYKEAETAYRIALDLNPTSIAGYAAYADHLFESGNQMEAVELLRDGISLAPWDYQGYLALAKIYSASGDDIGALSVLGEGLRIIPGSPQLHVRMGDLYSDHIIEVSNFLQEMELYRNLAEFRVNLYSNRVDTAENSRIRSIAQQKLWDAISGFERSEGNFEAARQEYLRIEPFADISLSAYQNALELEPGNESALLGLGRLKFATGFVEEGISYFQQSVSANPDSTLSLGYLANAYLDNQQQEDAISVFHQISKFDPDNPLIGLGIYSAYRETDNFNTASSARSAAYGQIRWKSFLDLLRTG